MSNTMKEDETFLRITNRDIYKKLETEEEIHREILEQAKRTNGRVTLLEKRSLGVWIANNPIKFITYVLLVASILISDVRQPLIELLIKIFI